jgi:uncharacterized membrane protein YkgB
MTDEDWIKQERDHEYRMASLKEEADRRKRTALTERVVAVSWALGIVMVVGILATLVYIWQDSAGQRGQLVEKMCIESGGTWTAIGGGTSEVCVHLDKVTSQ